MPNEPSVETMCEVVARACGFKKCERIQGYDGPNGWVLGLPRYHDDPAACFEACEKLGLSYRLSGGETSCESELFRTGSDPVFDPIWQGFAASPALAMLRALYDYAKGQTHENTGD